MSKDFKTFLTSMNEKEEAAAPAPAPAEAELTPDSAEIALDPRLEKEIWLDSFEIAGKSVKIKSLGLGPTQPVVVYIDDKRWEVFPGPKSAKNAVRRYIKGNIKIKENFKIHNIDTVNFVKKLLGQIVFLYFIQKKGWLGVHRDENGVLDQNNFFESYSKKSMHIIKISSMIFWNHYFMKLFVLIRLFFLSDTINPSRIRMIRLAN